MIDFHELYDHQYWLTKDSFAKAFALINKPLPPPTSLPEDFLGKQKTVINKLFAL